MSSTGRTDVRRKDDFYQTPAWCTEAILKELDPSLGDRLLDPCCGKGAILKVANAFRLKSYGIEIDADRAKIAGLKQSKDALKIDWPRAELVVTNPPYSLALEFVTEFLEQCREINGAFLLRLNWLGSQDRAEFHKKHPADIYILSKRPSFAKFGKCRACNWQGSFEIDGPELPISCPAQGPDGQWCHAALKWCSSDSTEYAWFVWGPGRGNRWYVLS